MAEFIGFFCNIFGYLLDFLYKTFQNYGVAIILFSIIIKIILLPITIKQQKTTEKTAKLQDKIKEIQDKYKKDPEKMNTEMMNLYKEENLSPFSGCFSAIFQIIIILAMFYLVSQPLTFMLKIPKEDIKSYIDQVQTENNNNLHYKEIIVIRSGILPEEYKINMDFLGIDLASVPNENFTDFKALIIPLLYVLTSFISLRYSMSLNYKKKKEINNSDGQKSEFDNAMQMHNAMSWMMPLMSVSIAIIAPLGLALYWLVNNILQMGQQYFIKKFFTNNKEA